MQQLVKIDKLKPTQLPIYNIKMKYLLKKIDIFSSIIWNLQLKSILLSNCNIQVYEK